MKKHLATVLALMFTMGLSIDSQAAQIKDDQGKLQNVKVIDVEHHFGTETMWSLAYKAVGGDFEKGTGVPAETVKLHKAECFIDEHILKEMDEAGVDYAQISLTTPSAELFEVETAKRIAYEANNKAAEAVKKYPDRIGAYITLAPGDVEWSLKEIDRCVKMGLWGWSTMSNYAGKDRLDDPKYWPLLAKCNELNMPIFLHPYFPVNKEINEAGYTLDGPNFGFTYDTQLTFLRMIFRGVFDKYPKLKVILGHNAEGLAMYIDRVNTAHRQGMGAPKPEFGKLAHKPSYYLQHNLYGDTSGSFSLEALDYTKRIFGTKVLVLGTDYPYEDTKASVDLITKNKSLTFAEKKALLQDNAERLGFKRRL